MHRLTWLARQGSVAIILLSLAVPSARAVIVSTANLDATAIAPADDPGWNNVVHLNGASGVYLGNRWVLTADHNGAGPIRLSDGREFDMAPGSALRLNNSGIAALGSPDLAMFRLADDPGLPSLEIDTVWPPPGTPVVMIGNGRNRNSTLEGWHVSGAGAGTVWTPVAPPLANALGYSLATNSTKRWGMNEVSSGQTLINNSTVGFATRFDRFGLPLEAQSAVGDSGGGVFRHVDDQWKLVGIMAAAQTLTNQPANTAVFGNQTMIADLATYRGQITTLLTRPDPAWQNQRNHYDVNGSGLVSPLDYLIIFNELLRSGPHELTGGPPSNQRLFDVNGDNLISSLDALRIINALNGGTANPAAKIALDPNVMLVPEPAMWILASCGAVLSAVIFHRRRRQPRASALRGRLPDRR